MRITYLSSSYVPSRRASAVHVMKMCAGFAQVGHSVALVVKKNPGRTEKGVEDVFRFYDVERNFDIVSLPCPSRLGGASLYFANLARFLRDRRGDIDLVYTRDLGGGVLAAAMGIPFVFEIHGVPGTAVGRFLLGRIVRSRALRRFVVISAALLRDLEEERLAPRGAGKSTVVHDAADPPQITGPERPVPARDAGMFRVGYVGNLYPGRGVEMLVELAGHMPDVAFHIVGGAEPDLARWKQSSVPENLTLHGFVAPSRVPRILRGFDVLLMPHQRVVLAATGRSDISRWTSPLKMFEYMASGTPIIASRLPVLQEILEDGRNALLVAPEAVDDWIVAIRRLESDPALGARLSQAAFDDFISQHTWQRRAEKVVSGLPGPGSNRHHASRRVAEVREH